MPNAKVAPERGVYRDAFGNEFIVAAGDEIPVGAAYVENNPNKVDAASNYEDADAADRAADNPPERIVRTFGTAGDDLREIHERVAKGKDAIAEETAKSNETKPLDAPTDDAPANDDGLDATDGARELADANELDLASVEGTGADGRITKSDVEKALRAREEAREEE